VHFFGVDQEKLNPLFVSVIDPLEVAGPATENVSGKAAKNKHDRLTAVIAG
jgi:hypothetical protein